MVDLGLHGTTPEKIRVLAGGRPVVRLDRGGESRGCGPLPSGALDGADAILVSDYGRGVAAEPTVRAALGADVPVVWDPHPKGPEPVPGATLVTPNLKEAVAAANLKRDSPALDSALAAGEAAARVLAARWRAVAVAVTLGERGAVVVSGDGPPLAVPAPRVSAGDPCGAGDAFAATAAARIAAGALPSEAVHAAVQAASAFVAGERAEPPHGGDVAERVRAAGGTVVATGGCFDLLHAGHVRMLEQARALGRLPDRVPELGRVGGAPEGRRPALVAQDDRAAVLNGLACVDAVVVFDEDDPRAVLRTIRPHVWVKGGDYAVADLPEARTLAEWGGRAVIVPYVAGRSTTRLITEVLARAR